uniref:BTB domain-containing protein n=1 Tax=Aegilops tauschii TaxID=37682 RepID=M8AV91_AEGTA
MGIFILISLFVGIIDQASASPVLETILERRLQRVRESGKGGRAVVRIRGVTDDVAAAFVRLLYAGSRRGDGEVEEEVERYAEQLLVLAHAYRVPWLKRWCQEAIGSRLTPGTVEAIGSRLTPGTVVDALQLADLCDAPQLHLRCMRLLAKEFRAVERTEAWRFLRDNDPWQELDVLRRLHDADMRRRKWRRKRAEQKVYVELSDAMDILRHICTEGCTEVGPVGQAPAKSPCPAQFKLKEQQKEAMSASVAAKAGDGRWGLLVKKVKAVSVMSSLGKRSSPSQCC